MFTRLFPVVAASFLLSGCFWDKKVEVPVTCEWKQGRQLLGIERLFMHQRTSYSALVKQLDGTYALETLPTIKAPVFAVDVPTDNSMWAIENVKTCSDKNYPVDWSTTIHLHTLGSIEGGGWNAGKGAQGMTIPIQ
jgi:hypothetical protein